MVTQATPVITRAAITAGLRITEPITTLDGRTTTTAATEFTGTTSIIVITAIKLVRSISVRFNAAGLEAIPSQLFLPRARLSCLVGASLTKKIL